MSEEIKINMDDMSKFFEWFFIVSTSVDKDGIPVHEFVNKVIDAGEKDDKGELIGTNRFRMFVNDIEVNPLVAIKEMQEQFDRLVEDKAKDMIEERIDVQFSDIYQMLDEIKMGIDVRKKRIFPKAE